MSKCDMKDNARLPSESNPHLLKVSMNIYFLNEILPSNLVTCYNHRILDPDSEFRVIIFE